MTTRIAMEAGDRQKTTSMKYGFGWRPPRPLFHHRSLSRMRRKQKKQQEASQDHQRFSHSPPGHTCGLPCCSEDLQIVGRLNAPSARYSCMPVGQAGQADLENNFTFRRNKLIIGRPTLTNKFFSLQTSRGGKVRGGLPMFQDDFGIEEACEELGHSPQEAHKNLRRYRASVETDTDADGDSQNYSDVGNYATIRHPVRHLQQWECFRNREIMLPDQPGTPRRMVFLDYRPDESHDEDGEKREEEEEETIEVYSSGFKPLSPSTTTTPERAVPSSSSSSARRRSKLYGFSSSVPSSTTTVTTNSLATTTTSSLSLTKAKVSYSGAVRPIQAPVIQGPLKSALKKPKPETKPEERKCSACFRKMQLKTEGQGQGQSLIQGQTLQGLEPQSLPLQDLTSEGHTLQSLVSQGYSLQVEKLSQGHAAQVQGRSSYLPDVPLLDKTLSVDGTVSLDGNFSIDGALTPQTDEDLYTGHVYDVVSDIRSRHSNDTSSVTTSKMTPKPPPVPPTRRNSKPQPEMGRKAITPEMKRRLLPDPHHQHHDISEERYSTFPIRSKHHLEVVPLTIEDIAEYIYNTTRYRAAAAAAAASGHGIDDNDISLLRNRLNAVVSASGDATSNNDIHTSRSVTGMLRSVEGDSSPNGSDCGGGGRRNKQRLCNLDSTDKTHGGISGSRDKHEKDDSCGSRRRLQTGNVDMLGESEAENSSFLTLDSSESGHSDPLTTDQLILQRNPADVFNLFTLEEARKKLLEKAREGDPHAYQHLHNPAFRSEAWTLASAGSVSSIDSARLSHLSCGSCQCTCVGGAAITSADDVRKNNVTEGIDDGAKPGGFLADNPITLIL